MRELEISGSAFCQFNRPCSYIRLRDVPLASQTPASCAGSINASSSSICITKHTILCSPEPASSSTLHKLGQRSTFVARIPLQELKLMELSSSSPLRSVLSELTLTRGRPEGSAGKSKRAKLSWVTQRTARRRAREL